VRRISNPVHPVEGKKTDISVRFSTVAGECGVANALGIPLSEVPKEPGIRPAPTNINRGLTVSGLGNPLLIILPV
jgi:hypothetical protein